MSKTAHLDIWPTNFFQWQASLRRPLPPTAPPQTASARTALERIWCERTFKVYYLSTFRRSRRWIVAVHCTELSCCVCVCVCDVGWQPCACWSYPGWVESSDNSVSESFGRRCLHVLSGQRRRQHALQRLIGRRMYVTQSLNIHSTHRPTHDEHWVMNSVSSSRRRTIAVYASPLHYRDSRATWHHSVTMHRWHWTHPSQVKLVVDGGRKAELSEVTGYIARW